LLAAAFLVTFFTIELFQQIHKQGLQYMIRLWIFTASLLIIILFIGCGTSSPTVATIGDEKITLGDFEENYAKNNGGWDSCKASSLEDRQKFLDLIIKYKLKVKEARAQGLEKDTAIINEMETYSNSVGQSYMIEKEMVEPGIQRLYKLRKVEMRASHIFLRLPANPKPEDTLAVYERAKAVIAALANTPFDTLVNKYSEDQNSKKNNGDLGYFVAGRMMSEFEDACFSLMPGEYTKKPVRTSYGYHIIKLTDRRPNPGSVRISHILLQFNESKSDTSKIRDSIWVIYKKIKEGGSFTEMVNKYSQDRGSAPRDGDIGMYEHERLPLSISEILYQIPIGSITEPIRFNYGYHIFKPTERKGFPPFEEVKGDLRNQYQTLYYKRDQKRYSTHLLTLYNITADSGAVIALIASSDSTKMVNEGRWKDSLSAALLKKPIIYCTGRPITVDNFIDRVTNISEFSRFRLTQANIWSFVSRISDILALDEHARNITKNYPELTKLMKEYQEGILLYRVEQDEVWKKTMVNDSLLKEHYNKTKENYRWPNRVNLAEIYLSKDSVAKAVYKLIRKKRKNFSDIAKEYTSRSGYRDKKGEWGLQAFTFNDLSRRASKMAIDSISEPFRFQGGWSIIKTLAIDSSRIKTFDEAMPEVAGAYQDVASKEREREWIDSLMKKYPIEIHKELLTEAFKGKPIESR
jgi:peptidyl-prolyl cis-trans isomerase SurA